MGNIRKNHSPSIKAQVVLEMLREEKTLAQISAEYGIHTTQLNRWRKQAIDNMSQLFSHGEAWDKEKAQYESKIDELYTEIGRLSTQLAWLKKKGIDVD